MFESAELDLKLSKSDFEKRVPDVREALLDAQARLRASFMLALRAYREREGAVGPVDGAQFYTFLRGSSPYRETMEQVNALARLFVEIEMLGIGADDARAVERAVSEAFAEAMGEPEFGADAVLDAVRASGIRLPPASV